MGWNPFSSSSNSDKNEAGKDAASKDEFVQNYLQTLNDPIYSKEYAAEVKKEKFEFTPTQEHKKPKANTTEKSETQLTLELIQKEGYVQMLKERKTKINEMSRENCADLEAEYKDCFTHGKYTEKMSLCWDKYNKFWNCVKSQKKLLDELNYGHPDNSVLKDKILADAALDVLLNPPTVEEDSKN